MNLLLRFFDSREGSILLNGRDIRDYPLAPLRSQIAVVYQDTYLYDTVAGERGVKMSGGQKQRMVPGKRNIN